MSDLPKPYFALGGATLYLGDCREILLLLPRDSVDLIVTDPPYGVNWRSNRGQNFEQMANDEGGLNIEEVLRESLRVLHYHRHLYVFGLRTFGDLPVGGNTEIMWDKGIVGAGDLSKPWAPQHEMILFGVSASKAGQKWGDGNLAARLRRGSVLRCDRKNATAVTKHPTEKPIPILCQMIESSSMLGETVLDPFAGSGSTLVAALIEGRKAIGIEIDPRYADVAAERIEEAAAWSAMMPR